MIPKKKILFADLIILIISFSGVYQVTQKATLPFSVISTKTGPIINSEKPVYYPLNGFRVKSVNSIIVNNTDEIEYILDGFRINNSVKILLSKNGQLLEKSFSLIPFYSLWYIALVLFTGFLTFVLSLIVLFKCTNKEICLIFHWLGISTAVILMTTWGNYNNPDFITGVIIKIFFTAAYSFLPTLFIHFTLVFPDKKIDVFTKLIPLLYTISTISFVVLSIAFVLTFQNINHTSLETYESLFKILRFILVAFLIVGMINFIRSYRNSKNIKEKKKLKWVLTGIISAPAVFILFWFIPGFFFNIKIIPEEVIIIFVAFVSITFAISITRYNLFDIDSLINRGVVYSFTIGIIIAFYLAIIYLLSEYIINVNPDLSSIFAAASVALLFQPAKNKIQKFVDKKFFRVQYNFRKEVTSLLNEIKNSLDIKSLSETIVNKIENLIPVEKIGFFLLEDNLKLKLFSHKNFNLLESRAIKLEKDKLKNFTYLPLALPEIIEPGLKFEAGDSEMFNRWKIKLIYPIISTSDSILAFIVLDKKKDGNKFTREDFDLLASITSAAANTIERIKLQVAIVKEHLETERLEEINKIKSFFISSVSHELKTPLTSIKMYTEMLKESKSISKDEKLKFLEIIEGECSRLNRLIDNVLDLSKIERGVKEYNFEDVNINELVKKVMKIMKYQFQKEQCKVNVNYSEKDNYVKIDYDSMVGVLINLIENGIKYSNSPKKIFISVTTDNNFINIKVKDWGIGISRDQIDKIMDKYYRAAIKQPYQIKGSGIGLALVKDVIKSHNGKINIESEINKGSTFTISLPKANK